HIRDLFAPSLITGVAPFDGISSMDDDFDDSSSEENSPEDSPIENRPLV
ncbi:YpjCB family protein, partial [Escherichia coli]